MERPTLASRIPLFLRVPLFLFVPLFLLCFDFEKSTVTLIRDTKNFEVEKFLDKLTEGLELLGDIKEKCIDNYTEKFIDIFHKTLKIRAPLRKQSR